MGFFVLAKAGDYSSPSFILRDPVITIEGGSSASSKFLYFSSSGQTAGGESTSTSFIQRGGLLYFPSIEVTPPPPPPPSPVVSGGSAGVIGLPQVTFKGLAYPASKITILKDGQIAAVTLAGPDAIFEAGLSNISNGDYNFGVWAADAAGRRSTVRTFSLTITTGANLVVSGIFLPPTISLDKVEVKRGDLLNILGQTVPSAEVSVTINSDEPLLKRISADKNGGWFYKLDTSEIDYGEHIAKARSATSQDISDFSQFVRFIVGLSNRENPLLAPPVLKGDFNNDNKVSLIDFSVAAYWYKRPSPPKTIDLDNNGVIDLVDFSIMAYYWTG